MEFGLFMELSVPRPWTRGLRAPGLRERARAGAPRRRARLRLRLGGRAPLPRGVLALLGARHLPLRRARRRPSASGSATAWWPACRSTRAPSGWPSGRRCSTSSRAGALELGTGRSATWTELERLRRQPRRDQEDLGRVRAGASRRCGCRSGSLERAHVLHARAGGAAQAAPEAAPADVGGGDVARAPRSTRPTAGSAAWACRPAGSRSRRRRWRTTGARIAERATRSAPSSTTRC